MLHDLIHKNIYIKDETNSMIANINEEGFKTIHLAEENEVNGITYKETCVNIGKHEVIVEKRKQKVN